jgi:hypothetical protein
MNYHLFLNGQQAGPYTEEQVRQFLAAGQVQGADMAWREGLAEWAPLASILPAEKVQPSTAAPAKPAAAAQRAMPTLAPRPAKVVEEEEEEEQSGFTTGTWIKIAVALAVAGILFLGAVIGVLFWQGGKMDASSKAYVDTYVSAIAPNWSPDDFVNHVAPQYRDQFSHDKVEALFSRLSTLGSLKQYDGSMGQAHISIRSLGKTVTAQYSAHAKFDNGDATFQLMLLRVDGQWTIVGLSIKSPVLQR